MSILSPDRPLDFNSSSRSLKGTILNSGMIDSCATGGCELRLCDSFFDRLGMSAAPKFFFMLKSDMMNSRSRDQIGFQSFGFLFKNSQVQKRFQTKLSSIFNCGFALCGYLLLFVVCCFVLFF